MQRGEVTWQGDEQRDAYGRGSRDPPECWLGLWQAPVLSVIPPALVKRDRIHHQLLSPSPLPRFSLGLGKVSNLLQMHDEFH